MKNVLGGLNYDAILGVQDYKAYRDLVEKEILNRFRIGMGAPPYNTPKYGIVDLENPASIAGSDTLRPLAVTVSTINPLQVAVTAGTAVTKSGAVVSLTSNYFSKELARSQANDINLVFLENEIVSSGNQALNEYMDNLKSQEVSSPDVLRVDLLENYNNASLYPEDRKNNIVVLAAITVVQTATNSLVLSIDQTQNTYSFIRPWFSLMDLQHRASVGTGTVSDTNPHGNSINDFDTTGNVNLFQGLVDTGLIVSRDMKLPKVLGSKFCAETIPLSRIKQDLSGKVTKGSRYGRVGAKYVELLGFPQTLGSCYELNNAGNSMAADLVPQTNILVFGPYETLSTSLQVEYTEVSALLPPVNTATNLLTFEQPNVNELIVVGGKTQPSIPDPTINFEGSGPFPRKYKVYLLANKSLVAYPQTIFPATRLDLMGTALITVNTSLQQPARLRIALSRVDMVSSMSVRMVIYGTNTNDENISEYVIISTASGYSDEQIPSTNYDSPYQGAYTENIFKSVSTIQVLDRINDGPLGIVQIWGEIEQSTAEGINDALPVVELGWNGHGIDYIKDLRTISKGFYKMQDMSLAHDAQVLLSSARLMTGNTIADLLFSDNFENMKFLDTVRGSGAPSKASGSIIINSNSAITAGDTITLKSGKILTAVAGVATTGTGQFSIGATLEDTKDNIVAAINSVVFDSGCTAISETGTKIKVVLNAPVGSIANTFKMTVATNYPGTIEVIGFTSAYDGYNECFFERSIIGLDSVNIPDAIEILPTQYHYRNKYRSRAVSLPFTLGPKREFLISLLGLNLYKPASVRIRSSYIDDPTVWTAWNVMTKVGDFYTHAFSEDVHKVQVEVYGTAHGIAVFVKN